MSVKIISKGVKVPVDCPHCGKVVRDVSYDQKANNSAEYKVIGVCSWCKCDFEVYVNDGLNRFKIETKGISEELSCPTCGNRDYYFFHPAKYLGDTITQISCGCCGCLFTDQID